VNGFKFLAGKLRTSQRTVARKDKGQPKPENLVETQVTTTEDDEAALDAIRKGRRRPPARPSPRSRYDRSVKGALTWSSDGGRRRSTPLHS